MKSLKKELREQCYLNPEKNRVLKNRFSKRSVRFVHWKHRNSVAGKRAACYTSCVHRQSM